MNKSLIPLSRDTFLLLNLYSCFGDDRIILLAKTTAAKNEVAFSYHKVRGLYFLAVIAEATIFNIGFR